MVQAVLTTDWNNIKSLADFNAQWPYFSADMGIRSAADALAKPSCDGGLSDLDDINGLIGYHDLSSKYVSRLDTAYSLAKNDLFLVSQTRPISAGSDVLSTSSRKLRYGELSSQLFYDILNGLKLRSMAYRAKREFAVSSHNHDSMYTLANIRLNPIYDSRSPSYVGDSATVDVCSCWLSTTLLSCSHAGKYESVACNPEHAKTDVNAFVWKVPRISPPIPPRPAVGTVRFVGVPTVKRLIDGNMLSVAAASSAAGATVQVNPYDSVGKVRADYDGWVFANGTEIENKGSALSAASEVYGASASDRSFHVPCFNEFFMANTGQVTVQAMENVVAAQVGLKPHLHQTGQHKFNGSITLDRDKTEMFSTDGCGHGVYVHNGDSKGEVVAIVAADVVLNLNSAEVTNVKTTACAGKGSDPYPKHQLVPVMVYVGGETEEYYAGLHGK